MVNLCICSLANDIQSISLHPNQSVAFLSHFEKAYLKQEQSTLRSWTDPEFSQLLAAKRLQKHDTQETRPHIFDEGSGHISEAGCSVRRDLQR